MKSGHPRDIRLVPTMIPIIMNFFMVQSEKTGEAGFDVLLEICRLIRRFTGRRLEKNGGSAGSI